MEIVPFQASFLPEAATLFADSFKRLRAQIDILPDDLEDTDQITSRITHLADRAFAAVEQGRLVGYLGAFVVEQFRDTKRKGAFCPEWGHAAADPAIYRALYRAASAQWSAVGCDVHAITLLAHDPAVRDVWFWQGFGLAVVDAIRPITPLDSAAPDGLTIRQATPDDAERLAALDAVHWRHYAQPPIFMVAQPSRDADGFRAFLSDPQNGAFLVLDGDSLVGFMQFEGSSHGAAAIVGSDSTVAITGAYVDPACRGRGAGKAILDAALRHFAGRGYTRCSVDFESFNPEAAAFWTRYFTPVCLSVMRVPETVGA